MVCCLDVLNDHLHLWLSIVWIFLEAYLGYEKLAEIRSFLGLQRRLKLISVMEIRCVVSRVVIFSIYTFTTLFNILLKLQESLDLFGVVSNHDIVYEELIISKSAVIVSLEALRIKAFWWIFQSHVVNYRVVIMPIDLDLRQFFMLNFKATPSGHRLWDFLFSRKAWIVDLNWLSLGPHSSHLRTVTVIDLRACRDRLRLTAGEYLIIKLGSLVP